MLFLSQEEKHKQRCGIDDSSDIWIERIVIIENKSEKEERDKGVHSIQRKEDH